MANFEWLDVIPDENWEKQLSGLGRAFDYDWFLEKSGAVGNDNWHEEFDIWGAEQPRKYSQFPRPPGIEGNALVWIVCGDWDTQNPA